MKSKPPIVFDTNTLIKQNITGDTDATQVMPVPSDGRILTRSEFFGLAELPPENEWFAGITNPHTRRAYKADIADFMAFTGIKKPEEFRIVTRGHVLAWRKSIEERELSGATIRRKMAALSSLFEYLSEKNAVMGSREQPNGQHA